MRRLLLTPLLVATPILLAGCAAPPEPTATNLTPTKSSPVADAAQTNAVNAPVAPQADDPDASRVFARKDLAVLPLKLKDKPFRLWLMDTPAKQQEGMMFLESKDVADDQGMLFPFDEIQLNDGSRGFWMHNTPIPLDIVYVSPDRNVVSVGNGVPYSEKTVPPGGDYQWVVELKAGTAKRLGLKRGDPVPIPPQYKRGKPPTPHNPALDPPIITN